jgi:hypothetical protein
MSLRIITLIVCLFLTLCSCTSDEDTGSASDLAAYFPQQFPELPFQRAPELAVFRGQELGDYIADDDLFHEYNFTDMATSNYRDNEVEIALDLYRFAKPADAWGFYLTTVPEKPYHIPLGAGGHTNNFDLYFAKGRLVARLTVYQDIRKYRMGMRYLAIALDKILPGDTSLPGEFDLFPSAGRLRDGLNYHGQDFLEIDFLDNVFSIGYKLGEEQRTLFLTDDHSGSKFADFISLTADWPNMVSGTDLPFDNGQVVIVDSGEFGWIMAGLLDGRLIGIVNYDRSLDSVMAAWLESLSA